MKRAGRGGGGKQERYEVGEMEVEESDGGGKAENE